jgi:hypothetical protein
MRLRRLSRFASAAPLVLALIAIGCVAAPEASTDQAQSRPPASTRAADLDRAPEGTDTVEEFRRDMATAQKFAEEYWRTRLRSDGVAFRPVRQVIAYSREGEVDCGGQPIGLNNAAYCSVGDFIAYDINWAYGAFKQIGDAFIYYLLGHEYAHAIQLRLRIRKQFTIQQELQADCMAGAYLGDSERADKLTVGDSDISEFRRGLEAVGDDPNQPWFAEGSHGTARQRTQAFVNGYEDSLEPCGLP